MTLPGFQPNHAPRCFVTSTFAAASFPQIITLWSPGTSDGCTMTRQFIVFSAFTTRASGNSRWICSPSESVLHTVSDGGIPFEKSSGLDTWTRIFPRKFAAPAWRSAAIEFAPLVQSKIISPNAAASVNVPICPLPPVDFCHSFPASLPAVREPIMV